MKWVKFFVWCRFNGEDFLNKWKGKKIMFVGDSLSLNMWESLSCMIHASVPNAKTSFLRRESQSTVIFQVMCFSFIFYLCLVSFFPFIFLTHFFLLFFRFFVFLSCFLFGVWFIQWYCSVNSEYNYPTFRLSFSFTCLFLLPFHSRHAFVYQILISFVTFLQHQLSFS
jgi:hypothetical protein